MAAKGDVAVTAHPLLRTLRARGTNSKVFFGYVGPGDADDRILLYPSLYDLSHYIEIPRASVLHAEEAPTQVLPFGGSVLWVRTDATIVRHRQENVTDVHGAPTSPVSEGRLRITRRAQRMEFASDDCHSPCSTCHSPCGNCSSPPCHAQIVEVAPSPRMD
ncbi:hypothetical protein [Streptomyces pseudovenezuelae]|uniref:hypothetical protein n=1 Tax=Streptomyces pseudovenezuelae TaxID=67350 RepID=UPI002E822D89|nr:hypothetical protein [Streptomyces pseudovenezuelae]WUA93902.1 hypothetical protein OHO81_44165 [Streptomyces pseudovenezuelae]